MGELTLGQYYPVDSVIHQMDPRTKLFGTMIFIIALFLSNSVTGYVLMTIFLLLCIKLSNVPIKMMLKGLRAIIFLVLISVSVNLFLTPGDPIFHIGFLKITREGIRISIFMALRLVYLVVGSSVMTLTTTPNALTDGLEKSLGFLKIIKIPVHEIAMMMSIALRFIPILVEETDKIKKAQMDRGADFETGNIVRKAKAMVPLLVPLFISAFRRATDLAMAMEARCYHGGEGRTKMKPLRYTKLDHIAYLVLISLLVISIVLSITAPTFELEILTRGMR